MDVLINTESLLPFLPELVLGGGVLLILIVDMLQRGSSRKVASGLTLFTLIAAGAALAATSDGDSSALFGGLIARDPFSDFWKVLFIATTAVVGIMATRSRETIDYTAGDRDAAEFYALNLAVCLGMFVMVAATDLLMAYLSLEMVSILSFALAGFRRHSRQSSEAALKYAIYGGVASGCMLYGLSLLYGMTGTISLAGLAAANLEAASPITLTVAVSLTLAGFGYKMAVVPFHQWCPDVYQGAPTPVTAFLSVGPKAAGFAMLMRFFIGVVPEQLYGGGAVLGSQPWPMLLGAIAVLTMTLGNVVALVQTNVKRMLAYSSIAHAGYLMLGMLAFGEYVDDGHTAIMFYLYTYFFMNIGAFGVVAALVESGFGENLRDFHRLGYRAPLIAGLMAVFLVSLTGLPPTAGFAGKFLLFASMIKAGAGSPHATLLYTIAVIGVVNSAISLFYYAKILRAMYFGHQGMDPGADSPAAIPSLHTGILVAMAVPTVILGIFWSPLLDWARASLALWQP
jgi:NADH-quinone oxidoreductase subunit N